MEITTAIVGAAQVTERLRSAPARLRERLREATAAAGVELQGIVKAEKLTGQVLRVRTGRLRRSINLRVQAKGDVISASVGTNVGYGRFWELGFQGTENVRAHVRHVAARDRTGVRRARELKGRTKLTWGQTASGVAFVRAHTRTLNVAPRPFLQPALAEIRPRFQARVRAVTAEGV